MNTQASSPSSAPPADAAIIRDAGDARLDDYRNLRERDLSDARRAEGLFVGETIHIVERMLAQPGLVRSVLASERMVDRVAALIAASASPTTPLLVATEAIMETTAGFHVHRGVLAMGLRARLDSRAPLSAPFVEAHILLALDGLNNMDNVGSIFRAAAAFGVGGVLLSRTSHDPLYRKSIRVSMGHALEVPFAWCEDLGVTLDELGRAREGQVLAADSSADAPTIDDWLADEAGAAAIDSPITLVIGSEFDGISASVSAACTSRVRIPMAARVDSLNAAVAASILLHRLAPRSREH